MLIISLEIYNKREIDLTTKMLKKTFSFTLGANIIKEIKL